jgi:hypothetical protein
LKLLDEPPLAVFGSPALELVSSFCCKSGRTACSEGGSRTIGLGGSPSVWPPLAEAALVGDAAGAGVAEPSLGALWKRSWPNFDPGIPADFICTRPAAC